VHESGCGALLRHSKIAGGHRAGEVQDRDDEPRLQHSPAGSARAAGVCAGLSALTGGVRAASCNGARGRQPGIKTAPDRGLTWALALHSFAQLRQNRQNQLLFEVPKSVRRGSFILNLPLASPGERRPAQRALMRRNSAPVPGR
jgi:hypothetical protein